MCQTLKYLTILLTKLAMIYTYSNLSIKPSRGDLLEREAYLIFICENDIKNKLPWLVSELFEEFFGQGPSSLH